MEKEAEARKNPILGSTILAGPSVCVRHAPAVYEASSPGVLYFPEFLRCNLTWNIFGKCSKCTLLFKGKTSCRARACNAILHVSYVTNILLLIGAQGEDVFV